MATWQYKLNVISPDSKEFPDVKSLTLPSEAKRSLESVLSRGESWDERLDVYGDVQRTCVEIWNKDGGVEEISVRLDLRSISEEVVRGIVEFVRVIGGVFQEVDGKIFDPNVQLLVQGMLRSDAYRFVKKPTDFLDAQKLSHES